MPVDRSHLIAALAEVASSFIGGVGTGCAVASTPVPGLGIWHSHAPTDSEPAVFEPRFYIVLQGRKTMTFGSRHVHVSPGMFALSAVGVPFVTAVEEATPRTPYLGAGLALDPAIIAELLLDLPDTPLIKAQTIFLGSADLSVLRPTRRLLEACMAPQDAAIIGPLVVKEILYRLLSSDAGPTVRQLITGPARLSQVRQVIARLQQTDLPIPNIDDLAGSVAMSATSLHRHFKAITGYSPTDYGKHLRLVSARAALVSGETSVAAAAHRHGYASASQFSREYKRKFGASPRSDPRTNDLST